MEDALGFEHPNEEMNFYLNNHNGMFNIGGMEQYYYTNQIRIRNLYNRHLSYVN